MVSIKDIARECRVSIATVSKALNDLSDISEETKEMVRQKAAELGYLPNASARALRTRRSHTIGVLFVDEAGSGLTHEFFSHVLNAFKIAAENQGYDLIFINRRIGSQSMTYLEHCLYRSVDGVVMACVDFNDPEILELAKSGLPMVTIDYAFDGKNAVLSDNRQGMAQLVRYVYEMGHRRIAYIHGNESLVHRSRMESFLRTMEELGAEAQKEYISASAFHDPKRAEKLTERLLSLKEPPTCILYPDDFSAFGGVGKLAELGLSIPEDISVAGYDGLRLAKVLNPELTTVVQDTKKMGETAAQRLIEEIEFPQEVHPEHILIRGTLSKGKSVRDIR